MITHAQIREKIAEMVKDDQALIRRKVETALKSGAFDVNDYQDDYVLPKIIYWAIIVELEAQRRPLHPEHRKAGTNVNALI